MRLFFHKKSLYLKLNGKLCATISLSYKSHTKFKNQNQRYIQDLERLLYGHIFWFLIFWTLKMYLQENFCGTHFSLYGVFFYIIINFICVNTAYLVTLAWQKKVFFAQIFSWFNTSWIYYINWLLTSWCLKIFTRWKWCSFITIYAVCNLLTLSCRRISTFIKVCMVRILEII